MATKNYRFYFLILFLTVLFAGCSSNEKIYKGTLDFSDSNIPFWNYTLGYKIFDSTYSLLVDKEINVYLFNKFKIPDIPDSKFLQIYIRKVSSDLLNEYPYIPERSATIDLVKITNNKLPRTYVTTVIKISRNKEKSSDNITWKPKKNVDYYRIDFFMLGSEKAIGYYFIPKNYLTLSSDLIKNSTLFTDKMNLLKKHGTVYYLPEKIAPDKLFLNNIYFQITAFMIDKRTSEIIQMTLPMDLHKAVYD